MLMEALRLSVLEEQARRERCVDTSQNLIHLLCVALLGGVLGLLIELLCPGRVFGLYMGLFSFFYAAVLGFPCPGVFVFTSSASRGLYGSVRAKYVR